MRRHRARRQIALRGVSLVVDRVGDHVALVVVGSRYPVALVRAAGAVVVGRRRLGADRPHGHRAGDPDKAGAEAERVRLHLLARQGVDLDVRGRADARARIEERLDAGVGDADVHAAGDPHEAARRATGDRQRLEVVHGRHVHRLRASRPAELVQLDVRGGVRLGCDMDERDPDAAGDTDEAAAHAGREPEDVFLRGALDRDALDGLGLEPEVAARVVVAAVDRHGVGAVGATVHHAVGADERLGVLGDECDADRDADSDVTSGEARRDDVELGLVARANRHVVARGEHSRAQEVRRSVGAALAIGSPAPGAGEGVRVEDRDGQGARHPDLAAARACDDRDDSFLALRADRDVVGGIYVSRVVDVRVGVQRHEVDAEANADARRAGDRERCRDAELVELVGRIDAH